MSKNYDSNEAVGKGIEADIEMLRALAKEKGLDKQGGRILQVLGTNNEEDAFVNEKNLLKYLQYLKLKVKFPCELTGIEDLGCFGWEEFYLLGPGNKHEYEKLKNENPSFKDVYELLGFLDEIDRDASILVHVKRISDGKEFNLPLVDLKSVDKKSKNSQTLHDYSVWHVNY